MCSFFWGGGDHDKVDRLFCLNNHSVWISFLLRSNMKMKCKISENKNGEVNIISVSHGIPKKNCTVNANVQAEIQPYTYFQLLVIFMSNDIKISGQNVSRS